MANSKRGQIKVMLDKERVLFYNLNALVALEDIGVDISKLSEGVKMSAIRGIVWAGLVHEDPSLTVEDVGDLIDFDNLNTVTDAIQKAFATEGK